jgi:hypothetical protein
VELVEVLALVPCSEMTQAHLGEEAHTVEVEPMMKTLGLAQTQRTWAHID